MARARLSTKRLLGVDRSGPNPEATRSDQPLHPLTIPNAIGFARLALIPVFLVVALSSSDGRSALAATLFGVIGWADYLDGFTARLTGQFSRLGALLDPIIDRAAGDLGDGRGVGFQAAAPLGARDRDRA